LISTNVYGLFRLYPLSTLQKETKRDYFVH
jgi:hypothetical protein